MSGSFSINEISKQLLQPSLVRQFDGEYCKSPTTLHILQWNILAQGLSNPQGNFVRVKKETTSYETRKMRILEQILLRQPDLCGMEEVDIYDTFLGEQLSKYGYNCFYSQKSPSPCLSFEQDRDNFKGPDGLLLCYKNDMFEEIKRHHIQKPFGDHEGKEFFSALELKHKPSATKIIFIVTHLKAKAQFDDIRKKQAEHIIKFVSENYANEKYVIITGDFNGDPTEPFYQIIRDNGFHSAYRTILNDCEPQFTTWKFRQHHGVEAELCRCIDYMFYKPEGLKPLATLRLPTKEEIGPDGLPCDQYPSDHLALETVFSLKV